MVRGRIDDAVQVLSLRSGRRRWIGAGLLAALLALLVAACAPSVPDRQQDLCAIFQQHPDWYDYAKDAEDEWGVPAPHPHGLRPPRIELPQRCAAAPQVRPLDHPVGPRVFRQGIRAGAGPCLERTTRPSAARSSAAARTWKTPSTSSAGTTTRTSRQLGIAKTDAYNLYLAYHEGPRRLPERRLEGEAQAAEHRQPGWPRPRASTRRSSSAANQSFA